MKILMVSSGFPPKINTGAEKFCYDLTKNLTGQGVEVEVATHTDLQAYNDICLHKLNKVQQKIPRKLLFDYYNLSNINLMDHIISVADPDIIHFHNVYGIGSSLISHVAREYPTVVTVHDYWPFCFNSTMMNKSKICTSNCRTCRFPLGTIHKKIKHKHLKDSFLVAPSHFMEKQLKQNGFKNTVTVNNGINLPASAAKNSNRLFFIGRLSPEKGIQLLVETISEMDLEIDIIGGGPLHPDKNDKIKQIVKPGINFRGFVEDITNEYLNGGILIIPSIWPDNFPYVILEGMSYGLPLICSDIGGIPEMIEHGKNGLLFRVEDKEDLKKQISLLINSPDIIREFGKNARKRVKNEFNWNKTTHEYLSLYKSLLEKKY